MSLRRKVSLLSICAIVAVVLAVIWLEPKGVLSAAMGCLTLLVLGVAFVLVLIGGRARLSERVAENVLIAGFLTYLFGLVLAVALLARSDLWSRFMGLLGSFGG